VDVSEKIKNKNHIYGTQQNDFSSFVIDIKFVYSEISGLVGF